MRLAALGQLGVDRFLSAQAAGERIGASRESLHMCAVLKIQSGIAWRRALFKNKLS